METFVFVIYDIETCEVYEVYRNEKECIQRYRDFYHGFVNVSMMGINIRYYADLAKE